MKEADTVSFLGGPWDGKTTAFEKLVTLLILKIDQRLYSYQLEIHGTVANVRRVYVYHGERIEPTEEVTV
jgi:hypothetical protein